jgi:guanylate kinase
MLLLRLSGHSGAGKSRLIAALPHFEVTCPRAVLYTSRLPRSGEVHGKDYYYLSRGAIAALPRENFFVGPVREMLQAVDLFQLEMDLQSNDLVLIEIFHKLWPPVRQAIEDRLKVKLHTHSVFMTAVDPERLRAMSDDQSRKGYIREEVARILAWRGKDDAASISKRANSAVDEVLAAIGLKGPSDYDRVFYSAPEGPDGEDEWTKEDQPVGRAKEVLLEFIEFVRSAGSA